MPNDASARTSVQENNVHPTGTETVTNDAINVPENTKQLLPEKIHNTNLYPVPQGCLNKDSNSVVKVISLHKGKCTNGRKNSTKGDNKSDWTSGSQSSIASLQSHTEGSREMLVMNKNDEACTIRQTEASFNTNALDKVKSETEMSVDLESYDPEFQTINSSVVNQVSIVQSTANEINSSVVNQVSIVQSTAEINSSVVNQVSIVQSTVNEINSSVVNQVSIVQSTGNDHKDTRSFRNQSRSSNDSSKRNGSSRPTVHDHHTTGASNSKKRGQKAGHRNPQYTPRTFDQTFPSTPLLPFSTQHSFYPSTTLPSNPQWNWVQHQKPTMKHKFNNAQNIQFLEFMPPYMPPQWSPTHYQANKHESVNKTSFTHSFLTENWSPGRWYRKNNGCTQVQNACPTRNKSNGQMNASSIKTKVNNSRHDKPIHINNTIFEHDIQTPGQSKNKRRRRHDPFKNCEQKPSATNVHSNDRNVLLENNITEPSQPDKQQISHLKLGNFSQIKHQNIHAVGESILNRPPPVTEQLNSQICNINTINSLQIPHTIANSCTVSKSKTKYKSSSKGNHNVVNNCTEVKYDIASTTNSGSKCNHFDETNNECFTMNCEQNMCKARKLFSSQTDQNMESKSSEACPNPQRSPLTSEDNHTSSYSSTHSLKMEGVTGQITKTEHTNARNGSSNLNEDIPERCMQNPRINDQINNVELDVCESNVKPSQTEDLTKIPKIDSTSHKLNPYAKSFIATNNAEIEEEMARAQSMFLPVNLDSKENVHYFASSLNPCAYEFCPKLTDSHGNHFVMTKKNGMCYFQPHDTFLKTNRTSTVSESDNHLDPTSFSDRTFTDPFFNYSKPPEDNGSSTYAPIEKVDSAFSQNLEQLMASSQYAGQEHALNDGSITNSVAPSHIASAGNPDCSYTSNSNPTDHETNYASLYNHYGYLTSPYTNHPSMPHVSHNALHTLAWNDQQNQTAAAYYGNPDGTFYSKSMPTLSPVALYPAQYVGFPYAVQTQLPLGIFPQTPVPTQALETQSNSSFQSPMEPNNQIGLSKPSVQHLNSLAENTNHDLKSVSSTIDPLGMQEDHGKDAQGRLTDTVSSNDDVLKTVQQACATVREENSCIDEYKQCKMLLEKLSSDKNLSLDHLRRNVLNEPEARRNVIQKWIDLALRIIEGSQNRLTVDEMAVSLFLLAPKMLSSNSTRNMFSFMEGVICN